MIHVLTLSDFPDPTMARTLSPNGRAHWTTKKRALRYVADNIMVAANVQNLPRMTGLVRMTPLFIYPNRRRRDDDNLAGGILKAVRDCLVRLGYLEADDVDYLIQDRAIPEVRPGVRALQLTFEFS